LHALRTGRLDAFIMGNYSRREALGRETDCPMSGLNKGDEPLCWKVHPLLDEALSKSLLLMAIVLGTVLIAWFSFGHFFYGLIALVVLVASLSSYFFPSYYTLGKEGIYREHLGHRRLRTWDEFRRVDVRTNGLFLSPFYRPTRLDSFRGFFLPLHKNREQVLYYVQCHVDCRTF